LATHELAWWKRLLDVQRPYRWNIRRLALGRTLDVGCGIGRNLASLPEGSVGVDHNQTSVEFARSRGLSAMTSQEFAGATRQPELFDSMLVAHVLEHLDDAEATQLLRTYLPSVRAQGTVVLICPQERGFASDATHVRFLDAGELARLCRVVGLEVTRSYSFPFPRPFGRVFAHNEFVVVARTGSAPPPQVTPSD
jgi:2-polyprenyl-3-methyl-5-hydroxy-6-metoxy-1,4-benzoquinol methylase